MRTFLLALVALIGFAGTVTAQVSTTNEPLPQLCRESSGQSVDWQACLGALPAGSGWRALALINLGTEAFIREDYAAAVRY